LIVHELSHSQWDCISGFNYYNDPVDWDRHFFFEGFATYCSEIYFKDIYPSGTTIVPVHDQFYQNGKNAISKLVQKHSIDVLFKIPKNWKEFSFEEI
jgi:hypothetical protein